MSIFFLGNPGFICVECHKEFQWRDHCIRHYCKINPKKRFRVIPNSKNSVLFAIKISMFFLENPAFMCVECHKEFRRRDHCIRHLTVSILFFVQKYLFSSFRNSINLLGWRYTVSNFYVRRRTAIVALHLKILQSDRNQAFFNVIKQNKCIFYMLINTKTADKHKKLLLFR